MSLNQYTSPSDDELVYIEELELKFKEIELIVLKYGKDKILKKHALVSLFNAGILCKESLKKENVFDEL